MKTIKENKNIEISSIKDVTPKKKKKFELSSQIIVMIMLVVVMSSITGYLCSEVGANYWETKVDNVVLEYGENFNVKLEDLVDTKKYSRVTEQNTILTDNFPDERPLPIGKYDVNVVHTVTWHLFGLEISPNDEVKTISVIVEDTIVPKVEAPTEIEIVKGTDITSYDFQKYIVTSDLSDIKDIKINTDSIDINNVGDYELNVVVSDSANNETNIQVKVKVIDVPEGKEVDKTKVVEQDDGTKKVMVEFKDKPKPTTTTIRTVKNDRPITTSSITVTQPITNQVITTQPTTVMQAQTMAQSQTTTSTSTQVTTTTPSITQPMKQKTHSSNGVCNHDIKVTGDWISVGGWYKTYEEAEFMAGKYIDEHGYGGNYLVEKCDKCGLWTPYVRNIQ